MMVKITEWFCDGCDEHLGTGSDKQPHNARIASGEVCISGEQKQEFNAILCKACTRKLRNAVDTRMWVKTPESRLPAVLVTPPPEDGA
jgi:hypothetical protein